MQVHEENPIKNRRNISGFCWQIIQRFINIIFQNNSFS